MLCRPSPWRPSDCHTASKFSNVFPAGSDCRRLTTWSAANARSAKPRKTGLTEIRGPYYSAYGPRHLADLFETVGAWVDGIKYAGGSFALMPADVVKSMNKMAHDHGAYVSTGGWIENVLRFGPSAVDRYIEEAKVLGFDVIDISAGFIRLPTDSLLRIVEK